MKKKNNPIEALAKAVREGNKFLREKIISLEQRFDSVDQRFKSVDQRFDSVDSKFKSIGKKFKSIDKKFRSVEEKIRFENAKTYALLLTQINRLEEKIGNLPEKDILYNKLDAVMKELQTIREEQTIQSGWKDQIEDHEDRIVLIEKRLSST